MSKVFSIILGLMISQSAFAAEIVLTPGSSTTVGSTVISCVATRNERACTYWGSPETNACHERTVGSGCVLKGKRGVCDDSGESFGLCKCITDTAFEGSSK